MLCGHYREELINEVKINDLIMSVAKAIKKIK